MSKLSFRARALDTAKPMPILRTQDVPDLPDFAAINRAVPQMPTGMEKEEESEHHLQRAISAQQAFGRTVDHVIPTPEVFLVDEKHYDELYPPNYKIPRQLIHVQMPPFDQEYPEYDIDTEDEEWLNQMKPLLNLDVDVFEQMIECLEKNSTVQIIDLNEAKVFLRGVDESVQISVFDYWLNKKLTVQRSLMPTIKTEKRDGTSSNNPYVAFRRRTEKMQTRKNRKNDESSYEKMTKLRRDFECVRNLMILVKQRELVKYELLKIDGCILNDRYELNDVNSQIYNELTLASKINKDVSNKSSKLLKGEENTRKRKAKRKNGVVPNRTEMHEFSSEDENSTDLMYQNGQIVNEQDETDNPDGMFAFKRKKGCHYHAPLNSLSGWPWDPMEEGGAPNKKYGFYLTTVSCPPNHFIGYARRRIGRGGRLLFDRIPMPNIDVLDDPELQRHHYRPVSHGVETVDFNARRFDENNPSLVNSQARAADENKSLIRKIYEYNMRELNRLNERKQDPLLFQQQRTKQNRFDDGKPFPKMEDDPDNKSNKIPSSLRKYAKKFGPLTQETLEYITKDSFPSKMKIENMCVDSNFPISINKNDNILDKIDFVGTVNQPNQLPNKLENFGYPDKSPGEPGINMKNGSVLFCS